jgi:acetyl-CoA C-acetyltransferase
MPITQLRSARLPGQLARHVKSSRGFATSAQLRKELQDAYILSAARTPTAKVGAAAEPCL